MSQGAAEETAVTGFCSAGWGQESGSSAEGSCACSMDAVLKVTLLLQCRVRGSVKLQPLRAGCPRAYGSQRQPCGGCAQLSGVGKCRLTHRDLGL